MEKEHYKHYLDIVQVRHKERKTWELPDLEIEEVELFKEIPNNLTYPNIQPFLHE